MFFINCTNCPMKLSLGDGQATVPIESQTLQIIHHHTAAVTSPCGYFGPFTPSFDLYHQQSLHQSIARVSLVIVTLRIPRSVLQLGRLRRRSTVPG